MNNITIENIKSMVNKLENQIDGVTYLFFVANINPDFIGKEVRVQHNIGESWRDYSFMIIKVIYRMKKSIELLLEILEHKCVDYRSYISYEVEDMIIAFSRLYESPIIEDTTRYMKRESDKEFRDNLPKRSDVNSLYWRINILRNRAAHSSGGSYTKEGDYAARFISPSYKVNIYNEKEGTPTLNSSIIDIDNNIKKIIQDVILDKKYDTVDSIEYSKMSIFDILFPNKKPSGYQKKHPFSLFPSLKTFDLYSDFLSLCISIIDFCYKQTRVFYNEALSISNDKELDSRICPSTKTIRELFS